MENVQRERSTRLSARVCLRRLGRPGVDDVEIVVLADEDLLPVGRELEIPDVLEERLGLDVAVLDLDGLELGLAGGLRFAVDEEEGLFADGEPGIDARRERDLEDAVLDAGEVDRDHDLGGRLAGLLGRRPGGRSRFCRRVSCRFSSSCLSPHLKLGRRGEGERLFRRQADGVDLGRLVEIGLRLARPPGAAHGAPEVAVRQEIEPFAVRAPGGVVGIDPVVGQLGRPAGLRFEEHDLAEEVRRPGHRRASGCPGTRPGRRTCRLSETAILVRAFLPTLNSQS